MWTHHELIIQDQTLEFLERRKFLTFFGLKLPKSTLARKSSGNVEGKLLRIPQQQQNLGSLLLPGSRSWGISLDSDSLQFPCQVFLITNSFGACLEKVSLEEETLEKNLFGKDSREKPFWKRPLGKSLLEKPLWKTLFEKCPFGKSFFGKRPHWKRNFWKRPLWKSPFGRKLFGKGFFGKDLLGQTCLKKPFQKSLPSD